MQFAKDSFYAALRDRLVTVNPGRTAVVDGVLRPAIVATENEAADVQALDNTFRLVWGEAGLVGGGSRLMKIGCTVEYATRGQDGTAGDRGRGLGTLDGELMQISQPLRTVKTDYTRIPAASLGTAVFWTDLQFSEPKDEAGRISRAASTTVYFFREVAQ